MALNEKKLRHCSEIAEAQCTPFYLLDRQAFEDNYRALVGAFQSIYPGYRLSYSYKTNYVPYVCRCVKELGGYAEVVSDMEYTLARKLGYPNAQIVYNGPAKGPLMAEHVLGGGILNVDNLEEARRIARIAEEHGEAPLKLGIRINLDVAPDFISRFGFELGGHQLSQAMDFLRQQKNISVVGVHGHSGHARSLASWQRRAEILLCAADQLVEGVPEYISLGSGMFGRMDPRFACQFSGPVPSYADYAKAVLEPISAHYAQAEKRPLVFTEPGATLISKYVSFICRVKDIKHIGNKIFALVDGSFYNIGEICRGKRLPLDIIPAKVPHSSYEAADIVGYTCLEYDVLYRDYRGSLAVGDLLVFDNVGGYSIVSKPQFIQPNCPMFSLDGEGRLECIMREEAFDDVFDKFLF